MIRWRFAAICAAALCTALLMAPCQAQDSGGPKPFQGPADLRDQRPYQLLFFAFAPESARVLPKNTTRTSAQLDIANNLLIPYVNNGVIVHEDAETQRLAFKERRGLGSGWEASASLPIIWRNSGFTDKLIEDYHHLIGIMHPTPDIAPGRKGVSAYHDQILLVKADGTTVVNDGATFGVGDFQATLKHSISSSPWNACALRIGMKLPTGSASQLIGSGGTDYGIDLDGDVALTHRVGLFANLSYDVMQRAQHLDGLSISHMRRGMFAIEYYASDRNSWLLQNDISDAAVRTGDHFTDGNQATLTLVYKHRSNLHTTWSFGFTENGGLVAYQAPWAANIAPDPTFSFGWETQN